MINSPLVILGIPYLFLTDVCKECINLVSLFNEPRKNARSICIRLSFGNRMRSEATHQGRRSRRGERDLLKRTLLCSVLTCERENKNFVLMHHHGACGFCRVLGLLWHVCGVRQLQYTFHGIGVTLNR
jgi:hypothetical protein